jgi:hypothetical protein
MESTTTEINQNDFNNDIDLNDYSNEYLIQLISTAFTYYNPNNDKEEFEGSVENLIRNYSENYKPIQIKSNLKYFIDFIGKYSNSDIKFIENSLQNINMKPDFREQFIKMLINYNENVENMKNAMIEKITNHRMIDFNYSFKVKFVDSLSQKVDFIISIFFKFYDDNEEIKTIDLDLSINQFYYIFEELQKIDTLIKTLI